MHRRVLAALIGLICLGLPACAAPAEEEIVAHGSKHLPDTTTQDLVTYGDHFIQLTVVGETRIPPQWMVLMLAPIVQGTIDAPTTNQVGQQLDGLNVERAAALLNSTKPDPAAAKYMAEDPVVRWQNAAPK